MISNLKFWGRRLTEYLKTDLDSTEGIDDGESLVFYSHPFEVCLFKNARWLREWDFAYEVYVALCGNTWKYIGGNDIDLDLMVYQGKTFKYLANLVVDVRARNEDIEDFYSRVDYKYGEGVISMRVKRFFNWMGWEYTGLF